MDVIANIGSGTNLIPIRALGEPSGLEDEYVIFNFDSGHQLLSEIITEGKSYSDVAFFVLRVTPSRLKLEAQVTVGKYKEHKQGMAYLVNFLFQNLTFDEVVGGLSIFERHEYRQQQKALTHGVTDPNYERAFAMEILLPDDSVDIMVAMSPYGFRAINRSTAAQLKPGAFFIVLGTTSNEFFKNPVEDKLSLEELGMQAYEGVLPLRVSQLLKVITSMPSYNTHSGELKNLKVKIFRKDE